MRLKTPFIIAAFALAAFALPTLSTSAEASAKCGDRTKLIEKLEAKYKEVPVGLGLSQNNKAAFEVYASESGTWTVVMTMTNGLACVMAAGHSWQDLPKQLAGPVT